MLTYAQQVQIRLAARAGGLLMDEKNPGWAERVDPASLRMQSVNHCVVGQTVEGPPFIFFGRSSYLVKLRTLGIPASEQVHYGFALWAPVAREPGAWDALREAWLWQVTVRLITIPDPVVEVVENPMVLAG